MIRNNKGVKIAMVVGARPQFVKASMLSRALEKYADIHTFIVHTGQHYDSNMSDIFFKELGLTRPKYNLGIGSSTHGMQTGKMLSAAEKVLLKEKPTCIVVFGDTNSTIAAALAASKLKMSKKTQKNHFCYPLIVHVEAGLRSYNRRMPEEINRVVTDHISDICFCPSSLAVANLKKEGVSKGVYNVGDIMYDSLLHFIKHSDGKKLFLKLSLTPGEYYLATIHRQSNTDNKINLEKIITFLNGLDKKVVFPVHPRTKNALKHIKRKNNNIRFVAPLSYISMLHAEKNSKAIITDSGGVQKEAYYLGIPCLVLREQSEWKELLETGHNMLTSLDTSKAKKALNKLLQSKRRSKSKKFYGRGLASQKMATIIRTHARKKI